MQSCEGCELEKSHSITGLKRNTLNYSTGRSRQAQCVSFDNSISYYKRNLAFLCQDKIVIAKTHSWRSLMDKLVRKQGGDWLTVLKAALDIYTGEMEGFAELPAANEQRHAIMKDYMKDLLFTKIKTVVNGPSAHPSAPNPKGEEIEEDDFSLEEVAIKVAIEYCLAISEVEFLFNEIYTFFLENGLEAQFVSHLCAPITAGSFMNEYVPEDLLLKLVKAKEEAREFKMVEAIILNVNLESYAGKVSP